ncbi:MAG: sugar ABC transporter permease [Nitrososphaeria archaeon]
MVGMSTLSRRTASIVGIAFSFPFIFVFTIFILYPLLYGFYLAGDISKYYELLRDPLYVRSLFNTFLYVGVGVNLKMVFAFFFSGLLMYRKYPAVKILSVAYLLPWAIPDIAGILSFRWMLNSDWGVINLFLSEFGFPKIMWLNSYYTSMAAAIFFHIWKWTPLWTMTFYAGRLVIPPELYEAAKIDGATTFNELRHITIPLMKRLYILCTLLSTIWTMGDFNTIWLLTGGDPGGTTHLASTIAYKYALYFGDVSLGVSSYIVLMPFLLILIFAIIKIMGVPGER